MVNYEIKSQLAKLLATENIIVENQNVDTASFNVESRVLTLPKWEKASNEVYDMLVAHEVGHALYTPNEDFSNKKIPKSILNVTEDVRIEKLMKRRYGGITKTFYRGYSELSDNDFFCLEGEDISNMNLADRINLYSKIGNFIDIPFDEKEKEILKFVSETETFKDAILAAQMIYEYCKNKEKDQKPNQNNYSSSGNDASDTIESEDDEERNVSSNDNESELEAKTDSTFSDGVESLNSEFCSNRNNTYCEVPDVDLDKIIISNKTIHSIIDDMFHIQNLDNLFLNVDKKYSEFKKSAQKEVNYMVKEFECKKSADAYSRSSVSKTGVLDCSKLHTYKFNDDIFKKVNIIPDGKSHGLIFILDWSGSMKEHLIETIKQLYTLIWFCEKVNIPFDVYAFSNSYFGNENNPYTYNSGIKEVDKFYIDPAFSLMNFFTSGLKKSNFDKQLRDIFRISWYHCNWVQYLIPPQFSLSGTPLNEALICTHNIISQFKNKHNIQKIQCIILTDGEASPIPYGFVYGKDENGNKIGIRHIDPEYTYLRNLNTGYTYKFGYNYWNFTRVLLDDLRQSFPDVNFIGIRIGLMRDIMYIVRRFISLNEKEEKKIKKEKNYSLKNYSGYDSYIMISSNVLSNDDTFEVESNASKSKIKSAFNKSLKAKKLNKKVLNEFISLVS